MTVGKGRPASYSEADRTPRRPAPAHRVKTRPIGPAGLPEALQPSTLRLGITRGFQPFPSRLRMGALNLA